MLSNRFLDSRKNVHNFYQPADVVTERAMDWSKQRVWVRLREEDEDMELLPWIDPDNFNPGYLQRAMHLLPKRGNKPEWQHTQDYWAEKKDIPAIDLEAEEFLYE
jgi:hypothetical protein